MSGTAPELLAEPGWRCYRRLTSAPDSRPLLIGFALARLGVAAVIGSAHVRGLSKSGRACTRWAALQQAGMPGLLLLAFAYTVVGTSFEFAIIGWANARDTPALAGPVFAVSCVAAMAAAAGCGVARQRLGPIGPIVLGITAAVVGIQIASRSTYVVRMPDDAASVREEGLSGDHIAGDRGSPGQENTPDRGEGQDGRALHERAGLHEGVPLI